MTTTKNNEYKKLNFSNEQEQSQACLNSAEHEKNQGRKVLNVPNLRFPEFQGKWEESKLGDVATSISSGKSKASCGNYNLYGSTGVIGKTCEAFYEGQMLLIARVGANAGKLQIINEKCGITDNTLIVKTERIPATYIYYYLQHFNLNRLIFGSGQPLITGGMLKKVMIPLGNDAEQNKITNLLSLIDVHIATQSKVINRLQSLIKGLADNLLDNPLWEKTYLRSFMQFFSTNSLSWEQLSYKEGEIRNLHYGLIHGFLTSGIDSASLPMIKYGAMPKQYTLCKVGDVAFADASEDTGDIGKSVEFVDTIEADTICGLHTIHGRDVKNKTLVGFKGFAFNCRYFHDQIKRLAQGTKVFSITANNLSSCYVYLPDIEIQKVIVRLLKAYEEQLIVCRMTLKQYEKQKQYLLRQMFI